MVAGIADGVLWLTRRKEGPSLSEEFGIESSELTAMLPSESRRDKDSSGIMEVELLRLLLVGSSAFDTSA